MRRALPTLAMALLMACERRLTVSAPPEEVTRRVVNAQHGISSGDAPEIEALLKEEEAREIMPRVSRIHAAASSVLRASTSAKDPRVKDVALGRLEKKDINFDTVSIRYLETTFPDDPKVQEAIHKYKGGE